MPCDQARSNAFEANLNILKKHGWVNPRGEERTIVPISLLASLILDNNKQLTAHNIRHTPTLRRDYGQENIENQTL
jgi:hypothetical protein